MKQFFLVTLAGFFLNSIAFTQIGEVRNDTVYVVNDVNKPVEFSKAIGKYLLIQNIIPDDLPPNTRKLQIISSKSTEIDVKLVMVIEDKHILIPLELFTEKYYTLYIKKGNATLIGKKLIIR